MKLLPNAATACNNLQKKRSLCQPLINLAAHKILAMTKI